MALTRHAGVLDFLGAVLACRLSLGLVQHVLLLPSLQALG